MPKNKVQLVLKYIKKKQNKKLTNKFFLFLGFLLNKQLSLLIKVI